MYIRWLYRAWKCGAKIFIKPTTPFMSGVQSIQCIIFWIRPSTGSRRSLSLSKVWRRSIQLGVISPNYRSIYKVIISMAYLSVTLNLSILKQWKTQLQGLTIACPVGYRVQGWHGLQRVSLYLDRIHSFPHLFKPILVNLCRSPTKRNAETNNMAALKWKLVVCLVKPLTWLNKKTRNRINLSGQKLV